MMGLEPATFCMASSARTIEFALEREFSFYLGVQDSRVPSIRLVPAVVPAL